MLSFINNFSVRKKLLFMVVPPLLGMTAFALISTRSDLEQVGHLHFQQQLLNARQQLSTSLTSYYAVKQQLLTTTQVNTSGLVAEVEKLQQLTLLLPLDLHSNLNGLNELARLTTANQPELENLLNPNFPLATLGIRLETYSNQLAALADGITTRWHSSHHALLLAIGRLNNEGLLMHQVFTASYFPTGSYPYFVRLMSEFSSGLEGFSNSLPSITQSHFNTWQESSALQQINRIRANAEQIYLDGNFGLSQSATDWLELINKHLNELNQLESQLLKEAEENISHQLSQARQRLYFISGLNLLLISAGILVTWFIYLMLSRPLLELTRGMNFVAEKLDLSYLVKVSSKDETGQASAAFNAMLAQFKSLIHNVVKVAQRVEVSANSSKRVAAALEQQIYLGQQQLQLMLTNVQQLNTAIIGIANNAHVSRSASDEASQLADQGQTTLNHLELSNSNLASSLKKSAAQVKELAEQSYKIEGIVEVITHLADQTNLLALNAAIEAARAGEAGRGFAVVADEVRDLAARSGTATVEISDLLNTNRQVAEQADSLMQASLHTSIEVSEQLVEATTSLEAINQSIAGIQEVTLATSASANQQSSTANNLSNQAATIDTLYQEASVAVSELDETSQQLEMLINELSGELQKFTVEYS